MCREGSSVGKPNMEPEKGSLRSTLACSESIFRFHVGFLECTKAEVVHDLDAKMST